MNKVVSCRLFALLSRETPKLWVELVWSPSVNAWQASQAICVNALAPRWRAPVSDFLDPHTPHTSPIFLSDIIRNQEVPGTTKTKHLAPIARRLHTMGVN